MFKMNESSKIILKLPIQILRTKIHYRWMSTSIAAEEVKNKPDDVAQYPPIEDVVVTHRDKYRKMKNDWHSKIKRLPTVEQKLIELNMLKYYGYYSSVLNDLTLRSSCLNFLKFATRTQVYNNLPMHYYEDVREIEEAVSKIRGPVEELISLHYGHKIFREYLKPYPEIKNEQLQNQNFLIELNNVFMKYLDDSIPHLPCISVDLQPRIEAFWFVGGFKPIEFIRKKLKGRSSTANYADDPVDKPFRSSSRPAVAVRSNYGLPDVIPFDGNFEEIQKHPQEGAEGALESSENNVAVEENDYSAESFNPLPCSPYDTDPRAWAIPSRRRSAVILPGFWPGVKDEHGHLFLHSREMLNRSVQTYGESFAPVLRQQHAVVTSFTQAVAYGLYQGFTPVNEMTYPIVQQSVSSSGQMFQFALYQLNTSLLHSHYSTDNKRINYLWLSDDMPLFESVEGDNVKGLNDEVLKLLCTMYLKKGQPRENPNPYLADYKYLMHHDAPEEYKQEFQESLQKVMADWGKPRTHFIPEILPWEMIYKVLFKTRPSNKKTKFFENRWAMNPYTRRLDDYELEYIPKVRRLDFRITRKPRLNSEHLFKHDWKTLKKKPKLYDDDEIVFKTMNINKDTPPYFNGLLWHAGMNKRKPKI